MNVGLLGCDRRIRELLAAVIADGGRVVMAADLSESAFAGLLEDGLCDDRTARPASWEPLIDPSAVECVFVGGDGWNDTRADAVRKLVQAGRRLVVSHPLDLSMLWAYEIDMIRADSGASIHPYLPDRLHPFVSRLRGFIEAGLANASPLGGIDAILFERSFAAHDRDTVLRAFCRDADLLRAIAGDPTRLSTLGATSASTSFATLAVELSGPAKLPVRWQAFRGDATAAKLSLLGEHGVVAIDIPDGPDAAWTLRQTPSGGSAKPPETLAFDRPRAVLATLRRPPTGAADPIPPATWADACRSIELAETVPRSVAKGRGIDLHQEEFSEIGTFKGTMASLGCGIVLAGLVLLILATLVGGIARETGWAFGEQVAGAWPWIVLSVLVVFLALQIIPVLIPRSAASRPPGGPRP